MGHHLTDDGQFKSDRHPDLPAGKIVLSFRDPHAQLGLWVTAIDYRAHDPELSADMVTALARLGSAPPRAAVEDAWAWSLARERGLDPRETVRVFARVSDGEAEVHFVGSEGAVSAVRSALSDDRLAFQFVAGGRMVSVVEHALIAEDEVPPRAATDDGRPDFDGFLLALRAEGQWSAALHAEDETGRAAADQRALHALAQHVETVGRALGFLPVTRAATPKAPSAIPSRTQALAKWLRELADDVAAEARSESRTMAESAANLRAALDLLPEGALRESIRGLADRVASGRVPRGAADAATVANLRAAADALDGWV